ncbi:MAG: hypothetical protein IJS96_10165 [Schwartzia sp.]|nr:hypothetical protein [Schwartzia sp. (in: firmicutes)]
MARMVGIRKAPFFPPIGHGLDDALDESFFLFHILSQAPWAVKAMAYGEGACPSYLRIGKKFLSVDTSASGFGQERQRNKEALRIGYPMKVMREMFSEKKM